MASLGGEQHDANVEEKKQALKKEDQQSDGGSGQGLTANEKGMFASHLSVTVDFAYI
jgi:hypothetical protein